MASEGGMWNGGDEEELLLHFLERLENRVHNRRTFSFSGGIHDQTIGTVAQEAQISAAVEEAGSGGGVNQWIGRCERHALIREPKSGEKSDSAEFYIGGGFARTVDRVHVDGLD